MRDFADEKVQPGVLEKKYRNRILERQEHWQNEFRKKEQETRYLLSKTHQQKHTITRWLIMLIGGSIIGAIVGYIGRGVIRTFIDMEGGAVFSGAILGIAGTASYIVIKIYFIRENFDIYDGRESVMCFVSDALCASFCISSASVGNFFLGVPFEAPVGIAGCAAICFAICGIICVPLGIIRGGVIGGVAIGILGVFTYIHYNKGSHY
jgi:hypothetical protein